MADGKGCICGAYCESECGCDADWTPQKLIDAQKEIERLRLTDKEREALEELLTCLVIGEHPANPISLSAAIRGILAKTG